MTLDDLLQAVRSCFSGAADRERESAWLRLKLRRGYDGLMRQRRLVEALQHRASQKEKDARALTCRVESYLQAGNSIKAWHHALELDRTRHSLERDRVELGRLRQGYHDLVAEIGRLERRAGRRDEQLETSGPAGANAW